MDARVTRRGSQMIKNRKIRTKNARSSVSSTSSTRDLPVPELELPLAFLDSGVFGAATEVIVVLFSGNLMSIRSRMAKSLGACGACASSIIGALGL
ncbi:hypothetical protein C0989_010996 [Termitomyces sp. Mn162]|nr:hypothetical protein C0989_010996 [Termitomyces sp. Mn162]